MTRAEFEQTEIQAQNQFEREMVGEQRFNAPALAEQLGAARVRYAEAMEHLIEATRYFDQFTDEAEEFRELVPDDKQRALIVGRALQDCAYWDAETSAGEIRLARLGRIALAFHIDKERQEFAQS